VVGRCHAAALGREQRYFFGLSPYAARGWVVVRDEWAGGRSVALVERLCHPVAILGMHKYGVAGVFGGRG
jgi:hypothetical protein